MPDHARNAQPARRHHAVFVKMPAVKVGVGDDGAARHLVEGDVLGRKVRRAGNDYRVPHAVGVLQCPAQGLHAAQAAAHDRGQLPDAQAIEQPHLRVDPVFDRDHRKIGPVALARGACGGIGVDVAWARAAKARADVVDADDEKPVGVHRLAGANHVVPPADVFRGVCVMPRHMVRGVERVADQHGVAFFGIEHTIRFVSQRVVAQARAALQRQRPGKVHGLGDGDEGHGS